jgi:hypothetical protein
VNRKAETDRRKDRETGTTDFRSAFGFVHAAITIGKADHPLRAIYDAIRDYFQAKCIFPAGIILSLSFASPELIQGQTDKIDREMAG